MEHSTKTPTIVLISPLSISLQGIRLDGGREDEKRGRERGREGGREGGFMRMLRTSTTDGTGTVLTW